MSENDDQLEVTQDELTALKNRADMLGLTYHPSIGVEKLRTKVMEALVPEEKEVVESVVALSAADAEAAYRNQKRKEASELVRIRIACMNPNKKEWQGEIITTGNGVVGNFAKYVPFNAEEGWHVPRIIYTQLVNRKCQVFVTTKDNKGNSTRQGKLIKEFSIEVLPNLTMAELKDLAQRQALAQSID